MKPSDLCSTPIEVLLLEALMVCGWTHLVDVADAQDWARQAGISTFKGAFATKDRDGYLFVQAKVRLDGHAYQLDFAMLPAHGEKIVIEADGHKYHERTPDQAKHDRRRDRAAQLDGWTVLRFTGSEIVTDMLGVVNSIGVAYGQARRRWEDKIWSAYLAGLRNGGATEEQVATVDRMRWEEPSEP